MTSYERGDALVNFVINAEIIIKNNVVLILGKMKSKLMLVFVNILTCLDVF